MIVLSMENHVMKRFIQEDVSFVITVVDGKKNNEGSIDCRNGHEIGDVYVCEYGCPTDFCQKCMSDQAEFTKSTGLSKTFLLKNWGIRIKNTFFIPPVPNAVNGRRLSIR